MKYNELINELLDLLDKNEDIIKIKKIKKELQEDKNLIKQIQEYQLTKDINLKKELYQNPTYQEYLQAETNINYLILAIKKAWQIFSNRKC